MLITLRKPGSCLDGAVSEKRNKEHFIFVLAFLLKGFGFHCTNIILNSFQVFMLPFPLNLLVSYNFSVNFSDKKTHAIT